MSEKKETTGGVLVIPDDKNHPASFSYVSPRERKIIRDPRTGRQIVQPVVYTFQRGRPARVENERDFQDLLQEQAYMTDGRGFVPMFERVVASRGPGRVEAEQKVTGLLMQFLAHHNIDLDSLVKSASGETSKAIPEEADAGDNQSV